MLVVHKIVLLNKQIFAKFLPFRDIVFTLPNKDL